MNPPTEFDRVLGEWLLDGPNRAPEHAVDVALAHARRHPRRPDPLRPFRRDVMPRRQGLVLQPRLGLVLAVLGLVLAGVAVAAIGQRPSNDLVVPPSPPPSMAPSASASSSPSASTDPNSRQTFRVDSLQSAAGNKASLTVMDGSGLLLNAKSAAPPTQDPAGEITATNVEPAVVRLTWLGLPCDTVHVLEIDRQGSLVLARPRCFGDTTPRFLSVELTYSRPVDATTLSARIEEGTGLNGLPNATFDGLDSAGNRFAGSIHSSPLAISGAESSSGGGRTTVAIGRLEQASADSITLVWGRDPCVTHERIEISSTLRTITIKGDGCTAAVGGLERQVTLTFSGPVAASDWKLVEDPATPTPS